MIRPESRLDRAFARAVTLLAGACLSLSLSLGPATAGEGDLLYAEGLQLLRQGQFLAASQQLERAIKAQPAPERSFALGVAYYRLQRPAQAYQAYTQALSQLPPQALEARIRGGLGDVYFEMEDYAQAVEAYAKALEFKPGWAGMRLKLATGYLRLGRSGEALSETETLLREQPPGEAQSETYYLRSLIHLSRKQWDAAARELELLAADPGHRFEAWWHLSWLYRMQQRHDLAAGLAHRAVEQFGASLPQAYQLASAVLLERLTACLPGSDCRPAGEIARLRAYLERWLLMSPEQPQSHFELGWLEQLEGNWQAARDAYLHAYRLFPTRPDYLLRLAEMEWALGRRAQARDWLRLLPAPQSAIRRELPRWRSLSPEIFAAWAPPAGPAGDPGQDIIGFWLSWLEADTAAAGSPEAQVLQALRLWQAGQRPWADALLLQARRQAPQWWLPCELLGRIRLESGGADALAWLETAYQLNPVSRELALLLAERLPQGQPRRLHLQRALLSFPEDPHLQQLYLEELARG